MKRIIALLCCLVLLCAAVPALAVPTEKNTIIIDYHNFNRFSYSPESRQIALNAHTADGAQISYSIYSEDTSAKCDSATINADGVISVPANYVGHLKILVTASQTNTHAKTEKYYQYTFIPDMPTDVKAVSPSVGKVVVSWKLKYVYDYVLIEFINSKNTEEIYKIRIDDPKITSYETTNLKPGITYICRVNNMALTNRSIFSVFPTPVSVTVKQKELVKSFDVLDKTHNIKLKHTLIMKVGQKLQLKVVKVVPKTATVKSFKFRSSNTKIATINQKGQITALRKGDCYITVNSMDKGGAFKTYRLRVK